MDSAESSPLGCDPIANWAGPRPYRWQPDNQEMRHCHCLGTCLINALVEKAKFWWVRLDFTAKQSIRRRLFDVVDSDCFNWRFRILQFQSKLLLQRRKN